MWQCTANNFQSCYSS